MKSSKCWITAGILALLTLASGCSTTSQTENLLSAAGFTIRPATTPAQQAHLKTLPRGRVTMVQRSGKNYFVYPDVAREVVYVGQDAQYDKYQDLRLKAHLAAEQVEAAEMSTQSDWDGWGEWGGVMAVPVIRR